MQPRFKVRNWVLVVVCVMAPLASCQSAPPAATHDEIERWLQGSDPRMIAWGATFAAKSGDAVALPALERLAEKYKSLPFQRKDSQGNDASRTAEQEQQLDSMQAVLDAVIQLHGTITPGGTEAILPDFPAQALVLFATMPGSQRSRFAQAIYESQDRSDEPFSWDGNANQQMIYTAAAILALNPPPGFTATLIHETRITVKVAVTDDDRERDGWLAERTCVDSIQLSPAPGWPQPYTYVVEQHWPSEGSKDRILVAGFPNITSRRALSSSSCYALPGFTSVQKLLLAQQEARLPSSEKPAGSLQYDTLRYTDPAAFPSALAALITQHRQPFLKLTKALVDNGYVKASESGEAMYEFAIEIDDQRRDKSQTLQMPRDLGPRTSVNPYETNNGAFIRQE